MYFYLPSLADFIHNLKHQVDVKNITVTAT